MDIYDSRYFVINKTLLRCCGLWPYQNQAEKLWRRFCFAVVTSSMGVPHLIGSYIHHGSNNDRVLEHVAVLLCATLALLKMFTSVWFEDKYKIMYNSITVNWRTIVDKQEKRILLEYSERGRFFTVIYITYILSTCGFFISLPLTPVIQDKIWPLNESRPHIFILNGEFIVDRDENYAKIYMFDMVTCLFTCFIIMTVDTIYVNCMKHCCGLFCIIQHRLRLPGKLIYKEDLLKSNQTDATYDWLVKTVKLHKIVLEFTYTLQRTYSMSYLLLMGVNLTYFSILSVLVQVNIGNKLNLFRYIMLLSGLLLHIFYLSWPGQELIDHSSELYRDAYFNEWYEGSTKSKKLLRFFILRCYEPSKLTAGGLYTMNFSNFLMIMKTSVSYIAVVSSFR